MIDYKVTIVDGLHHDVDSSVLAFELASRACFKEACTQGGLKLLEPIMRVEVVTPEDYMGDVIGDLNSRRGQISTQEQRGNATVITAMVPLGKYVWLHKQSKINVSRKSAIFNVLWSLF